MRCLFHSFQHRRLLSSLLPSPFVIAIAIAAVNRHWYTKTPLYVNFSMILIHDYDDDDVWIKILKKTTLEFIWYDGKPQPKRLPISVTFIATSDRLLLIILMEKYTQFLTRTHVRILSKCIKAKRQRHILNRLLDKETKMLQNFKEIAKFQM